MMSQKLQRTLVQQFRRPHGVLGHVAGAVMTWRPSNRQRTLRTVEQLDIQPGDNVLEIGFGPGLGIEAAAQRVDGGRVLGVDHSEVMLRVACRRNARAIASGRVDLHLGTVETLPREPEQFDRIFAVNVHMFWKDPQRTLTLLRDRLSPGGMLAITFQPRTPGATRDDSERAASQLMELFRKAAFSEVQTHVFAMKPVPAVCVSGSPSD